VKPEGIQPQPNEATLKVFEVTYPPLSQVEFDEVSRQTLSCYVDRGIEWIQSYLSFDRTRLICELNAPDLESVREVQHKLNITFDRVWPAMVIKL
ncbi:MAG: nickel-binding protein, partial [Microcoleus sp.]